MSKFLKYFLRIFLFLFVLVNIIAAFNAYKFTHFYNFNEIEIIPQDKKTNWDKTKEILFGINAVKQKNTIADSLTKTVYLTTTNNLKLEAWYTNVKNSKGTVCMFHGHGSQKSATNAEALAFRQMGFNTFQLDFRAHGNSEGNTCTIGYDESEDVKLAYDFIKSTSEKNIILWGISLGGATVAKAINDYNLEPNKIILEMPFGTLLQATEGRIKMMKIAPEPLSKFLLFWGGLEHGFWPFNIKPTEYAKKIKCPTLIQWGLNDPRVTREEIDAIYNNLSTQKKLVVYDNCAHESLCKKENEKWISSVFDFIK